MMGRCGHTRTDFGNQVGLRQHREQRRLRRDEAGHRGEQRLAQVGNAEARVLHTVVGLGLGEQQTVSAKPRKQPAGYSSRYTSHIPVSYIA